MFYGHSVKSVKSSTSKKSHGTVSEHNVVNFNHH